MVVRLNLVEDVVCSGVRPVLRLTLADGRSLTGTADHLIFTAQGWKPLGCLASSCSVAVDRTTRRQKKDGGGFIPGRRVSEVQPSVGKYHPYARVCKINKGCNITYRVEVHHLVYEAHLNGMSLEEFKDATYFPNELAFVDPSNFHIRHKDEDHWNNTINNLEKMERLDHSRLHCGGYESFGHGNLNFVRVRSVAPAGLQNTYDICCTAPHHSFVANGIVVHNSGKTRIMVARLARYVAEGNSPTSAAVTSFTSVAAREIKERYAALTGDDLSQPSRRPRPAIGTGHSFAMRLTCRIFGFARTPLSEGENRRLLRELPTFQATKPDFSELDDALSSLCSCANLHLLAWPEFNAAGGLVRVHDVSAAASGRSSDLRDRPDFREQYALANWFSAGAAEKRVAGMAPESSRHLRAAVLERYSAMTGLDEEDFVRLLIEYLTAKHVSGVLDFSDMLYYPFLLMIQHPHLRDRVRRQFRMFLADEAQDMSALDYGLLALSAGFPDWGRSWPDGRSLMIVGDSKQSLFEWRDGKPLLMDSLDRYLECDTVQFGTLRRNYRSAEGIVRVSGEYAKTFSRRHLFESLPVREDNPNPIEIHRFPNTTQEDKALVARLRQTHAEGTPWADCTVLCRMNRDLDQVEAALIAAAIPYRKKSSRRLSGTVAFGYVNAMLGLALNPRNVLAASTLALGLYGIGEAAVSRLQQALLTRIQSDPGATVEALLPLLREKAAAPLGTMLDTLMPAIRGCLFGMPMPEAMEQMRVSLATRFHWADAESAAMGIRMSHKWAPVARVTGLVGDVVAVLMEDAEFAVLSGPRQFQEVCAALSLADEPEDSPGTRDGVVLTTIHGYKGSENKNVFGVHLTRKMRVSERDADGERSAFYVLATRARDLLYLSSSEKIMDENRWRFGVLNTNLADFATRHSAWRRLRM